MDCCKFPIPDMSPSEVNHNLCAKECKEAKKPGDDCCLFACNMRQKGIMRKGSLQSDILAESYKVMGGGTKQQIEEWEPIVKKAVDECVAKCENFLKMIGTKLADLFLISQLIHSKMHPAYMIIWVLS
jgi:hypothetical protein